MNSVLTPREYDIAGNSFRAYRDSGGKLVFVIDNTLNERKTNVMLVINPVGDRKWDDILANDYAVDLETVRPKKDNKYQKLDIEYSGLAEYDDLIRAYENGDDLTSALGALARFRDASVRRAAMERLSVAEANAARARDTILKTNDSIAELRVRLRQLRRTLANQKNQIGREPTKQSASKILRTDAQIDAINEKLRRAERRLDNAQRRLVVADEDAAVARNILACDPVAGDSGVGVTSVIDVLRPHDVDVQNQNLPVIQPRNDLIATTPAPDADVSDVDAPDGDVVDPGASGDAEYNVDYDQDFNVNITEQPKADTMAEEDVKPLFDKNPEILDEEIAFKPIQFGVSSPVSDEQNQSDVSSGDNNDVLSGAPLSFTPPAESKPSVTNDALPSDNQYAQQPSPVLDSLSAVGATPTPETNVEQTNDVAQDVVQPAAPSAANRPAPVMPNVAPENTLGNNIPNNNYVNENSQTVPAPAGGAPIANAPRPVSPITGTPAPTNPAPRRPTAIYYIMLVLLIALSVFTLWLYQKNTNDGSPDLTATIQPAEENVAVDVVVDDVDSPFVPTITTTDTEPDVVTTVVADVAPDTGDVVEPVVAPETVQDVDIEPVAELIPEPEPVVVPEPVQDVPPVIETTTVAPVVTPAPILEPEPVVIESEEEILANKPAYNVSQNENMFVADPEYETETQYTVTQDLPKCPDGSAPDMNGCCPGEIYTDLGAAGFNCCPETGGDCFPPLL